jgi:hypothetical protein
LACQDKSGPDTRAGGTDTDQTTGDDTNTSPGDDTSADSGSVTDPPGCRHEEASPLTATTCVRQAACTWDGDQSSAYSGFAIASGRDVDGDGREDIVIGAPLFDLQTMTSGLLADAGGVRIISGGGISDADQGLRGRLAGRGDGDMLGAAVDLAPDLNGDGLAEIVAGARGSSSSGETGAGEAVLLLGSVSGWAEDEDTDTIVPTSRYLGERAYSRTGKTVEGGLDTDGDGLGELWITGELKRVSEGSSYEYNAMGRIYRIAGRTDGWPEEASLADADAAIDGIDSTGAAGLGLAADADLDGDGHGDLVIGAPYATANKGTVYILSGGPESFQGASSLADADVQIAGEMASDAFGWAVAVGDVTGDGAPDLIVGAPLADSSTPDAGLVAIYEGGPSIFTSGPSLVSQIAGEFDDHQLGTGLAAGRDLTGDGQADLVMGAVNAWQGLITKGGRVYVLAGSSTLTATMSARFLDQQIYGAQVKEYLGRAASLADMDADGRTDLLVGSGYSHTDSGNYMGQVYLFWGD